MVAITTDRQTDPDKDEVMLVDCELWVNVGNIDDVPIVL